MGARRAEAELTHCRLTEADRVPRCRKALGSRGMRVLRSPARAPAHDAILSSTRASAAVGILTRPPPIRASKACEQVGSCPTTRSTSTLGGWARNSARRSSTPPYNESQTATGRLQPPASIASRVVCTAALRAKSALGRGSDRPPPATGPSCGSSFAPGKKVAGTYRLRGSRSSPTSHGGTGSPKAPLAGLAVCAEMPGQSPGPTMAPAV